MTSVDVNALLQLEEAGSPRAVTAADFKTSDPAAGPGTLEATQQLVLTAVDQLEPKLDTLHTDLTKLLTPVAAVSYGSGTGNQAPVAPADATGRLIGYAIREAAATPAAAVVRFRSGTTVSGTPLGSGVSLAPGESVREWFGPAGITVPTAIFLERVSGTTEVTVYWAAP